MLNEIVYSPTFLHLPKTIASKRVPGTKEFGSWLRFKEGHHRHARPRRGPHRHTVPRRLQRGGCHKISKFDWDRMCKIIADKRSRDWWSGGIIGILPTSRTCTPSCNAPCTRTSSGSPPAPSTVWKSVLQMPQQACPMSGRGCNADQKTTLTLSLLTQFIRHLAAPPMQDFLVSE